MPMLKFCDTVCETEVVSLVSVSLTPKQYQDVQLEYLQHDIRLDPDQLKSVWDRDNEDNGFFFAVTLWPPTTAQVTESGIKR